MGWTGIEHHRGKLKADEVRREIGHNSEWDGDNGKHYRQVFTSIKSNAAYGYLEENGIPILILVYAIRNGAKEFMFKEMSETAGPCYYDCPQKLLDMVPCPDSPFAIGWRKKVASLKDEKKTKPNFSKTLENDNVVKIDSQETTDHGNIFHIQSIFTPFKGRRTITARSLKNGQLYKLRFSQIVEIVAKKKEDFKDGGKIFNV